MATAAGRASAAWPRIVGHQHGAETVRRIVTECGRLHHDHGNPKYLTLYSFSTENWKRPADEVNFLMGMYVEYLRQELPTMMENNVRFHQIGRTEGLPARGDPGARRGHRGHRRATPA